MHSLNKYPEIIIATSNNHKFADFLLYLGDDYKLVQSTSLTFKIEVREGIDSLADNAIAKAKAMSVATGKIAIGDDTGFFIDELNGEPGVALRRWGGELGENATDAEFWLHLQKKTQDLESLKCHFRQCVAVYSPNGKVKVIYNYNHGVLNRDKLKSPYNNTQIPISSAFESNRRVKSWDEMSDEEKKVFDNIFITELKSAISEIM